MAVLLGSWLGFCRWETHQNDLSVLLDFLHEFLEALLEFTTVLGSGNKQSHVQSDDLQISDLQLATVLKVKAQDI